MAAVLDFNITDLPLVSKGKVRHLYEVDEDTLLLAVSDRISAFDVVMKNGIPDKGKVLSQLSAFWMNLLKHIVVNHFITDTLADMPVKVQRHNKELRARCQLVRRVKMFPIEAIVRGYLAGSAWKEYQSKGTVGGNAMPEGLVKGSKLPTPLFTPSTKAEEGHDVNITQDEAAELIGREMCDKMAATALKLYSAAADYAQSRGIIIADTKFEFGVDKQGNLVLADEVLTPDSSRFWEADEYQPGLDMKSYDKQFVRDWLEANVGDKDTAVTLPDSVVAETRSKYIKAYERLAQGNVDLAQEGWLTGPASAQAAYVTRRL